uniref:Uncharacterized protein n=1 Tax=Anguilla anguilla TaxID=7936 RepID=A0A0E9P614_ANGAN
MFFFKIQVSLELHCVQLPVVIVTSSTRMLQLRTF